MTPNEANRDLLERTLERLDAELDSMMEIGKALTSTLKIEEVLNIIMERVGSLLKPTAWSLLLVDEQSGELVYEIAVSPSGNTQKGEKLEKGRGIAGWVAEHGKQLLVPDLREAPQFLVDTENTPSVSCQSAIGIPVKSQERTLGVIELLKSSEDGEFGEGDLRILATIADFAAIAIENARAHDKVNVLAVTDELTGLWNNRRFNELLDYELERAKRYGNEFSLIFVDLDHFKSINDSHGHLVGSRILAEVGRLLGGSIRKLDSAARFGGDEYVLMLPNTSRSWGRVLAERLCTRLRVTPFKADDGTPLTVTGSFGVAGFPEDGATAGELLAAADKAMYAVKESTRDGIRMAGE